MARVNIEDRIFCESRLNKLAKKMGWDSAKALGVLTYIWHDSQELLQVECSAEDIVTYARVIDETESEKFISALKSARFVSGSENGLLKIHGNDVQIDRRVSALKGAVKGAEGTKKRWAELKSIKAQGIAPTTPDPGSIQTRPDQTRPDHSPLTGSMSPQNAGDPPDDEKTENSKPEKTRADVAGLVRVWNENRGTLPEATALDDSRRKAASARLRAQPDLSWWADLARKISGDPFCCGENDRNWRANFDYFTRAKTYRRAMEGGFGSGKGKKFSIKDWVPPELRDKEAAS